MIMNATQIENWALNIIEMVKNNAPVEDVRVELKREWPDYVKAARRIAGHANSSFGEPILWLIGLDEHLGVVGVSQNEISSWFSQVKSCFEGISPDLVDLNILYDGKTIVALLFDTSRAPFVVKNPHYGQRGSGQVELEVPWRESTMVRSARRSDLLRLLVQTQNLPSIEVLNGSFTGQKPDLMGPHNFTWNLYLSLYFVPKSQEQIVIPFHKCSLIITLSNALDKREFEYLTLRPSKRNPTTQVPGSVNLIGTESELIVKGPGMATLHSSLEVENTPSSLNEDSAVMQLRIAPALSTLSISIDCVFKKRAEFDYYLNSSTVSTS